MSESKLKRFYTEVALREEDGFHVITLDGRTAKTPGRQLLGAQGRTLAAAIAEEWDAQAEHIELGAMPLTRLQGFALDGGEGARAEWSETVLSYLGSDLLCYRAPDADLAKRQADLWQPVLDRVGERCGGRFAVTEGIIAVEQPEEVTRGAGELIAALTPGELFALKLLTEITGSAALALALVHEETSPDEAFAASRLDETHQQEVWGVDAEAAARTEALRRDFDDVVRFLALNRV